MSSSSETVAVADGALLCPNCAGEYVHLDDAYAAGRRREDGEVRPVHVNAAGDITTGPMVSSPISDTGRRHAFALAGWCEFCRTKFAIEFAQHKGQTRIQVTQLGAADEASSEQP